MSIISNSLLLKHEFGNIKTHYYSDKLFIYTDCRNIYIQENGVACKKVNLVGRWWHYMAINRFIARLFRSDQYNIMPVLNMRLIYVIRDGVVYQLSIDSVSNVKSIGKLPFRGIMHNSHCILPNGHIIFGYYGNVTNHGNLFLFIIDPFSQTMFQSEVLKDIKGKHIHSIRWDSISKTIWICTGDMDSECYIIILNESLEILEILGDGSQSYRTCDFIFQKDSVIWAMDSPLEQSYIVKYNRKTGGLTYLMKINGPGWHTVKVGDYYYLSIIFEPGFGVKVLGPQILISSDAEKWELYKGYTKDWLPSIFKFGVCEIGTSDGVHFYINHQANLGKDGVSEIYGLNVMDY